MKEKMRGQGRLVDFFVRPLFKMFGQSAVTMVFARLLSMR